MLLPVVENFLMRTLELGKIIWIILFPNEKSSSNTFDLGVIQPYMIIVIGAQFAKGRKQEGGLPKMKNLPIFSCNSAESFENCSIFHEEMASSYDISPRRWNKIFLDTFWKFCLSECNDSGLRVLRWLANFIFLKIVHSLEAQSLLSNQPLF